MTTNVCDKPFPEIAKAPETDSTQKGILPVQSDSTQAERI